MSARQQGFFSKSDVTAVLLLVSLLLVAGSFTLYQKSTAVLPPEMVVSYAESESAGHLDRIPPPDNVTAETLIARKIDINTAPADSLALLPGIGPRLAARIVSYRNETGGFRDIDDLQLVRGIGPVKLDGVRNMITVGSQ